MSTRMRGKVGRCAPALELADDDPKSTASVERLSPPCRGGPFGEQPVKLLFDGARVSCRHVPFNSLGKTFAVRDPRFPSQDRPRTVQISRTRSDSNRLCEVVVDGARPPTHDIE